MKPGSEGQQKSILVSIDKPHDHDVLCGRGGRTNLHQGNIWFRRLVRSNRALYKTCPKHTKLLVAKAVVKAVQGQDPPGRYLEIDKATKRWQEIPYKRALDKTSQALRERDLGTGLYAPKARKAASKNASLDVLSDVALLQVGLLGNSSQQSSRNAAATEGVSKKRNSLDASQKSASWNRATPIPSGAPQPNLKRQRAHERQEDVHPLPLDALQTRQSSFFNFLSNTGILGGSSKPPPPPPTQASQSPLLYGNISNSNNMIGNNNGQQMLDHTNMEVNNNNSNFALQQQQQEQQCHTLGDQLATMRQQPKMQQRNSLVDAFEPFPIAQSNGGNNFASSNNDNVATMDQMLVRQQMESLQRNSHDTASNNGFGLTQNTRERFEQGNAPEVMASPNRAGLTTQVSDWLTSFFPATGGEILGASAPPPPGQDLQRSISSTLFNFARSPSQFLTSLKTGVTSIFMDQNPVEPPDSLTQNRSLGKPSESQKDSLLEDTEDTPLEIRMRHFEY